MDRMISPDRALELVLKHVPSPRPVSCSLRHALGRVLAESITAPEEVPSFLRAMMDGYAVALSDAGREVDVIGLVGAGHEVQHAVSPGRCVQIMTGAPCPEGTEAVVKVEQTERRGDRVVLPSTIQAQQHMQATGALCHKDAVTLSPGVQITPLVLGHLASFGRGEVLVYRLPEVVVISTGDELVSSDGPLAPGKIRDSNGPMLVALTEELGATSVSRIHAVDTLESIESCLQAAQDADFIVLSGGVSMGTFDLVPDRIASMGMELVFHKATQEPGKPMLLAVSNGRMIFGLPGNPQGSHFCFTRYVAPAIRKFFGHDAPSREEMGSLVSPYPCEGSRTLFVPMRAQAREDGGWDLHPFDSHGSSDVYSTVRANVYVRFPPGRHENGAGTQHPFSWMGPSHG